MILLAHGGEVSKIDGKWVLNHENSVTDAEDRLVCFILLLELAPTEELIAQLDDFPLTKLLRGALNSKNPRWVEYAVTWLEVLPAKTIELVALVSAEASLPTSSQNLKHRLARLIYANVG